MNTNITRNRLAKYNLNGTLPAPWDSNANGSVTTLAVSGNNIYAGGTFTTIATLTTTYVVKLNKTTGAIGSWTTVTGGSVEDIEVNCSNIYLAGSFTSVGGNPRNRCAKVVISTGAVSAFNPDFTSTFFPSVKPVIMFLKYDLPSTRM